MNTLLLAAGLLSIFVGLIHSILGELLIFKKVRDGAIVPAVSSGLLGEGNIRILWATWHIASIFGWVAGVMLISIANNGFSGSALFIQYISASMFAAGLLVFIATKARHPGWIGLCGVAILCWLA